jgi:uncharacterized protein YgbK (DUF1537 family)
MADAVDRLEEWRRHYNNDRPRTSIGHACHDVRLVTGRSGIAMALPANFINEGSAKGGAAGFASVTGPEASFAGSCSGETLRQIEVHSANHPILNVDVDSLLRGELEPSHLAEFILKRAGHAPLVFPSGSSDQVRAVLKKYGREELASRLDRLFSETAQAVVNAGVRRLVVASGETSGAVVSALGLGELMIGPEIDPGVAVPFTQGESPIALALKSGNFGSRDFFSKALRHLEQPN